MFMVVGLGNPGAEYAGNRHNIGFMVVDEMVRRHSFSPWRTKHHGVVCEGMLAGQKVLALKPTTYMNRSGLSVGDAARFFKIPPAQIIVLHDELELAPGKLRVKQGGGHAGHNGLRDIDAQVGNETWRVRLGIGRPHDKALVHKWVLSDFAKADQTWLEPFLTAVVDNLPLLVRGDSADFMNRIALATQPPKPPKPPKAPKAAPQTSPQTEGTAKDGI